MGVIVLCLGFNLTYSQKTITLNFKAVFGEQELALDSLYLLENNQRITIENLKFYISNIELIKKNKTIWKEKVSYHLYDQSVIATHSLKLNTPSKIEFDKVKFYLGIDSMTNVSGAMGGDLDPTKGMYWTWQSGYINFKLEGTSSLSTHPKKEFQLHLGGYQTPYNTLQTIFLNTGYNENVIVDFDIKHLIEKTNIKAKDHIMSPGDDAVKISAMLYECLKIK